MVQYALKRGIITLIVCLIALTLVAGCNGHKQNEKNTYHDWRNVSIDSLEQALATKTLTDSDRLQIHLYLAMGYQQSDYNVLASNDP